MRIWRGEWVSTLLVLLRYSPSHAALNGLGSRERTKKKGKVDLQPYRVEDAFDIQIHDLSEHSIGVRIKLLSPRRTGIGKQDIDMVGRLGDFLDEELDTLDLGAVGRDRDGLCTGLEVGQGIQCLDGGIAS